MFRFSIREMMLVTAMVALGVAWFAEHTRAQAALKYGKEACGQAEFWERINRESEISFREQLAEYGLNFGYVHYLKPTVYEIPQHELAVGSKPKSKIAKSGTTTPNGL